MDSKKKKTKKKKIIPSDIEVIAASESEFALPEKPASKAVVSYDPLAAYLREMRNLPRLSPEEQHQLAIDYYENKNLQSAYKLVKANLWLVVKISREYERLAKSVLDLIQEGNMGLMEAVKNFDPLRGVQLPSYAVWWIRAYIIRYILANWRMVKIGTTQAQRKLFFNLNKEKERLERQGFQATPKLLAEKLDVRESDVTEMEQRLSGSDLSVDAPLGPEDEGTMHGVLASSAPNSDEILAAKEFQETISKAFAEFKKTLNSKQLVIFEKRMVGEEKPVLQDLAEELGISMERVRQIENQIKEKLRIFLLENYNAQLEDENF